MRGSVVATQVFEGIAKFLLCSGVGECCRHARFDFSDEPIRLGGDVGFNRMFYVAALIEIIVNSYTNGDES